MLLETSDYPDSRLGVTTLNRPLRTADVARRVGCSVQQVRNLERDGSLEPARRTPSEYRTWTATHAQAAATYVALAAGAGLHAERRDVELARAAVATISAEPVDDVRPDDAMTISELATALDVPTSTLRHWDREGLLTPARTAHGRARIYAPADVRDARVVHQLRLAGYRVPPLMPVIRQRGRTFDITTARQARDANINSRSRALLQAAARLLTLTSTAEPKPRPLNPTG